MYLFTALIGIIILVYFLFLRSSGTRASQTPPGAKTPTTTTRNNNKYQNLEVHLNEISKKSDRETKPKLSFTLNELFVDDEGNLIKTSVPIEIFLANLSYNFDVFCFFTKKSKDENIAVNTFLSTVKSKIPSHRVMTSSNQEGLSAMIRQLNPVFHIERNINLIPKISSYVQKIAYIAPTPEQLETLNGLNTKKNIKTFTSFEDFLLKTSTFALLSDK